MVVFGLRLNVELTLVNADAVVEVVAICVVGGNVVVYSLCSLFSTLRRLRDSEIDFNKEIGKKNSDCKKNLNGERCAKINTFLLVHRTSRGFFWPGVSVGSHISS